MTALLVAGNSLSIGGGGDYSPHTSATRIFFLVNSLIGASAMSLVLSYLVQVYSANATLWRSPLI
ncbi:ion channel [Rhizobium leguminosarum]|uniref:ion channel n=1 Tax=Rhizobium leguminosarum TaxID=384 RepID=UPI003D0508D8